MTTIITVRAKVEGVNIDAETVRLLADIGDKTSLRYAVQLLTPASILAKIRGGDAAVSRADVEESRVLFVDAKTSARIVSADPSKFLL